MGCPIHTLGSSTITVINDLVNNCDCGAPQGCCGTPHFLQWIGGEHMEVNIWHIWRWNIWRWTYDSAVYFNIVTNWLQQLFSTIKGSSCGEEVAICVNYKSFSESKLSELFDWPKRMKWRQYHDSSLYCNFVGGGSNNYQQRVAIQPPGPNNWLILHSIFLESVLQNYDE